MPPDPPPQQTRVTVARFQAPPPLPELKVRSAVPVDKWDKGLLQIGPYI